MQAERTAHMGPCVGKDAGKCWGENKAGRAESGGRDRLILGQTGRSQITWGLPSLRKDLGEFRGRLGLSGIRSAS